MAKIQNYLNNIKNAMFGRDVRGSIHDGIDAINKEVEDTTARQKVLDSTFEQLIINAGNSNAEVVAGRVKEDGTSFDTIGDRMADSEGKISVLDENKANETEVIKKGHANLNDFDEESRKALVGGDYNLNYVLGKDNVTGYNIINGAINTNKFSNRVYDSWLWDVVCRTINENQTTYLSILIPKTIAINNGKIKMYAEINIDNYDLYNVSIAFFNATSATNISSSILTLKSTEYPQFFTKTNKGVTISFEFADRSATNDNITCMISFYKKDSTDTVINFKVNNLQLNDIYVSKLYPYALFSSAASLKNSVEVKTDEYCLTKKQDFEELKNSFNVLSNTFKNRWYGKVINILGDSITFGVGASTTNKRYADLLANKLGCTINNYSVSGTYISHMEDNNGFVDRYNDMTDNCDGVLVFGSTNDYWVGEVDINIFRNDLITLINGLNTKYVGKEIYFITPYNQFWQSKNSDSLNSANAKLIDYVNVIKEECMNHGIDVIDLYSKSGMDIAHNETHRNYYSSSELDGVHVNDNGHKKISNIIYLAMR